MIELIFKTKFAFSRVQLLLVLLKQYYLVLYGKTTYMLFLFVTSWLSGLSLSLKLLGDPMADETSHLPSVDER